MYWGREQGKGHDKYSLNHQRESKDARRMRALEGKEIDCFSFLFFFLYYIL